MKNYSSSEPQSQPLYLAGFTGRLEQVKSDVNESLHQVEGFSLFRGEKSAQGWM